MKYWILLLFAILAEVIGTLSMKWAAVYQQPIGYILMLIMIGISYLLLALAIKKIALGVAYAIWEGIGIFLITLCSVVFFDEAISLTKILGLIAIIIGISLIKTGTKSAKERRYAAR